jgi:DNA-binding transcriptional regulator YhcF (GntR family)
MGARSELVTRLRDRILSELHLGRLHAGDRLPSIRELASHIGADQRVVAQVYRLLEAEGLVEVRGRSGVYVAPQDRFGGELLAETAQWVAETLTDAWKRRIRVSDFPELVRRCTATVRLHCACIESNEDHLTSLCTEASDDFGLEVHPVYIDALGEAEEGRVINVDRLPSELRSADLLLTSAFHAGVVRPIAAVLQKPLLVMRVHPDLVDAIERHLRTAPLTFVSADPGFGERMRTLHGNVGGENRIRVVLADDADAVAGLNPSEPVLLTRAARERLGDVDLPLIAPHSPSFSAESARELMELLIRLNMEAQQR